MQFHKIICPTWPWTTLTLPPTSHSTTERKQFLSRSASLLLLFLSQWPYHCRCALRAPDAFPFANRPFPRFPLRGWNCPHVPVSPPSPRRLAPCVLLPR